MQSSEKVPLEMSPNVKQAVPLFGVSDIQASLRFYVDGLGFAIQKSWSPEGQIRWCWLQIGEAALMLQTSRVPIPKRDGMSICFTCSDAIALYKQFRERGVDAARPFVGNGLWVTIVIDPDGYKLEFSSPTDVAEDTEYSESTP
jgi:catechol 2,3-dioxygenase-like lactoylglutathione lyase family enzyme